VTRPARPGGTGLGLAIVTSVELHGGQVSAVNSALAPTVVLPLREQPPSSARNCRVTAVDRCHARPLALGVHAIDVGGNSSAC
jgi:hypothetical protein